MHGGMRGWRAGLWHRRGALAARQQCQGHSGVQPSSLPCFAAQPQLTACNMHHHRLQQRRPFTHHTQCLCCLNVPPTWTPWVEHVDGVLPMCGRAHVVVMHHIVCDLVLHKRVALVIAAAGALPHRAGDGVAEPVSHHAAGVADAEDDAGLEGLQGAGGEAWW